LKTYLDASFAVSLYSPDANFLHASKAIQATSDFLVISYLCALETTNSFYLRVFRKVATVAEAQQSQFEFERDLERGILLRQTMPDRSYLRAHQLTLQHTAQLGTRGADVLHVAIALELGADAFFSFDLQQRKLAATAGLSLNPF
jgi:hypothetical protein